MKHWVAGMRDSFFESLFKLAKTDRNVILVTSDIGAVCHDKFKKVLPGQYINAGIAEQNMVSLAAGLALSGKRVYLYTIIPFLTMRCYEQIRVDLCCMNLPVTLVGIGAGLDYSTLGPTHHGVSDIAIMRSLPHMVIYSPSDNLMAQKIADGSYKSRGPQYIRLDRVGAPLIYKTVKDIHLAKGFSVVRKGRDLYIISTGRMVQRSLDVAKKLSKQSIDAGVIDLFRLDEVKGELAKVVGSQDAVVTLEEHSEVGGIGEAVAGFLAQRSHRPQLIRIALENKFCRDYGGREYVLKVNGLDVKSIVKRIRNLLRGRD